MRHFRIMGGRRLDRAMIMRARYRSGARYFSAGRRIPHAPYKRLEFTTAFTNISTTPQVLAINQIPQGTNVDGERTEMKINAINLRMTAQIGWDQTNGSWELRAILCDAKDTFSGTGVTLQANIYDKRDFPEIGHVYSDRRYVCPTSTSIRKLVVWKIRRFRRHYYYDADGATDYSPNGYNQLCLVVVGATGPGATTTAISYMNGVLHYQG